MFNIDYFVQDKKVYVVTEIYKEFYLLCILLFGLI